MTWQLRFWGVRGSIPCPGPGTARYGGNTACLAIEGPEGAPLVLDAGTGARALGLDLEARRADEVNVLLSHTHWDHIQGLPFFAPLYRRGGVVRLRGPARRPGDLRQVLEAQMAPAVFPVPPSALEAQVEVEEVEEGWSEIAGWMVRGMRLCHPGVTFGYRLERQGLAGSLAYLTDNELTGQAHGAAPQWRADLVHFLRGVSTLVHDAMYAEDQLPSRAGWGHSSPRQAVALAAEAGCRRLVLFHHNPDHDDTALDALLETTRAEASRVAAGLTVEAAIEGETLTLE